MKPNFNNRNRFRKEEKYFVGMLIRAKEVRCIDSENVNHGVLSLKQALQLAEIQGLDLVQINPNGKEEIPICKILDFSKFKYEQAKKEKLSKKQQRENSIKIKELKFRPSTDDNDLKTKAKQAQEFLNENNKVKVTIVFKGREMAYASIAKETFDKFCSFLNDFTFEMQPTLNGRFLTSVIVRKVEQNRQSASL